MQIQVKEFGTDYSTYQFGYTLWATREQNDTLADIYNHGFLPYSSDLTKKEVHYMARSARIRLADFEPSSENRRIKNKFAQENFLVDEVPVASLLQNQAFIDFCLTYFEARHGVGIFSKERLLHILSFSRDVVVTRYMQTDKPLAYIIERRDANMRHYWFSFYDLALVHRSFGSFLMLDAIERAKQAGTLHMYLGTVYGEKALYKANYEPLEYWSGSEWVSDLEQLKRIAREDSKA